jgi:hypothetical protein
MSVIKFCSSFQNLFIKEDIGSPDELPIHMIGGGSGTWSRTCETFRDQLAPRGSPDLSTSHRRIGLPWPLTAFTERYCIRCGPACPLSCQSCVPMSVIKFRRHFRTCFIRDIGSPDAVPIHMDGEEGGTWSAKLSKSTCATWFPGLSDVRVFIGLPSGH